RRPPARGLFAERARRVDPRALEGRRQAGLDRPDLSVRRDVGRAVFGSRRMRRILSCGLVVAFAVAAPISAQDAKSPASDAARALDWIERQAVPVTGVTKKELEGAVLFPEAAETPKQQDPQIYGGSAGVLLFLENAAAVLDDARARKLADATAKGLLATRGQT